MASNGGCILRIRETLHTLSPKELHLADYILAQPETAVNLPIGELAAASGVSASTVNRLCKSLHYAGYKEFSRKLYSDLSMPQENYEFEDIHPGDEPQVVLKTICASSIRAIENTMAIIDPAELDKAVAALCKARRVDFYGAGVSGLVALDAQSKFLRCGKSAMSCTSPHDQILAALTLTKEDVAVLISYSGETNDILSLAKDIRKIGATVITLTRYGKNSLSELADIRLYSSSTETMKRSGAMSSRMAQLFILDTLYAAVCSSSFGRVKQHLETTRVAIQRLHTQVGNARGQ